MTTEIFYIAPNDEFVELFYGQSPVKYRHFKDINDLITHINKQEIRKALAIYNVNSTADLHKTVLHPKVVDLNLKNFVWLKGENEELVNTCLQNGLDDIFFGASKSYIKHKALTALNIVDRKTHQNGPWKDLSPLLQDGLTKKEAKIIHSLLSAPKYTCNKNHLCELIWKNNSLSTNTLDVHMCNLRKKLTLVGYDLVSQRQGTIKLIKKNIVPTYSHSFSVNS